jgi:diketogulonate reductase-like aldo/keto reductase
MHIGRRDVLRMLGGAMVTGIANSQASAEATPSGLLSRKLKGGSEALPVIGLGTWQTFDVGASRSERAPLAEVLRTFVNLGGRLVDTSPMYGRAETVLGDLAKELGLTSQLFMATKVWTRGKQAGIAQMRDSMHKLRTERIDLMQVHNLLDVEAHLDTLAGEKREGRVRHVGITHYTASQHDEVARVLAKYPVDFVQINYSVAEREAERLLLPLARERDVAVIANRPFAGGELFARVRQEPLPEFAGELGCQSWAQLLLKFVVSHPAITCAIPATAKVAHLRDNMQACHGPLPDERLRQRIAEATR